MNLKLMGALMIFAGCGGFGFSMAAYHCREERMLRQYLLALEFMECDLSCRMTPLPQLCRDTARVVEGPMHLFLTELARQMELCREPDASSCVRAALSVTPGFSPEMEQLLVLLGHCLGRFDLPGQLQGLRSGAERGKLALDALQQNRTGRLRSYQTLGLCTGAALAILLL